MRYIFKICTIILLITGKTICAQTIIITLKQNECAGCHIALYQIRKFAFENKIPLDFVFQKSMQKDSAEIISSMEEIKSLQKNEKIIFDDTLEKKFSDPIYSYFSFVSSEDTFKHPLKGFSIDSFQRIHAKKINKLYEVNFSGYAPISINRMVYTNNMLYVMDGTTNVLKMLSLQDSLPTWISYHPKNDMLYFYKILYGDSARYYYAIDSTQNAGVGAKASIAYIAEYGSKLCMATKLYITYGMMSFPVTFYSIIDKDNFLKTYVVKSKADFVNAAVLKAIASVSDPKQYMKQFDSLNRAVVNKDTTLFYELPQDGFVPNEFGVYLLLGYSSHTTKSIPKNLDFIRSFTLKNENTLCQNDEIIPLTKPRIYEDYNIGDNALTICSHAPYFMFKIAPELFNIETKEHYVLPVSIGHPKFDIAHRDIKIDMNIVDFFVRDTIVKLIYTNAQKQLKLLVYNLKNAAIVSEKNLLDDKFTSDYIMNTAIFKDFNTVFIYNIENKKLFEYKID